MTTIVDDSSELVAAPAPLAPPARPARRGIARRFAGRLGDVLMTVAATAGVLSVLLVLAAVALHVSLIMFKTGSMAPTIPAGSLAVVREIPASQIRVGEVVTVDRPNELPVSHRVVKVTGSGDSRTVVLKGDANLAPDVQPYVVTHVRKVLWSVPGGASAIVWVGRPQVMAVVVVAVAVLVTWSFWPRRSEGRSTSRRAARS